jgi:hypothetical protein
MENQQNEQKSTAPDQSSAVQSEQKMYSEEDVKGLMEETAEAYMENPFIPFADWWKDHKKS